MVGAPLTVRWRLAWVIAASLCALALDVGCDSAVVARTDAGTRDVEAGMEVPGDAMPTDAGPAPMSDAGPLRRGEGDNDDSFTDSSPVDSASCRDGLDNDDDMLFDCADPFCQRAVPSCCVGQSSAVCCTPQTISALSLEGCSGALPECAGTSDYHFFGLAAPDVRIQTGELVPSVIITEDRSDTGWVLDRVLDPNAGDITVSGSIAVPMRDTAEAAQALGLGLVPAAGPLEDLVRVTPAVGLVLSGNRRELIVLAGDRVITTHPIGEETGYLACQVTLGPDGRAEIRVSLPDGGELVQTRFEIGTQRAVRAIYWGRGTNPGTETPLRARSLSVSQLACDMPDSLVRADRSVVPPEDAPPGTWEDRSIRSAGALRMDDGRVRLAMDLDGDIVLGLAQAGETRFVVSDRPGFSTLTQAWGSAGVSHPTLHQSADGTVELWFTAHGPSGASIASITEREGAFDPGDAEQRLAPEDLLEGVQQVDHGRPFLVDSATRLMVREQRVDGAEVLAVWSLDEPPSRVATVTQRAADDVFAFDRDELGGTSVFRDDGVYRVYYAGRRGLRWSIGVAVSDDALTWHPESEPVLSSIEGPTDTLGVRAPSALVGDDGLSLYFLGSRDGADRIGVATSPYPRLPSPG